MDQRALPRIASVISLWLIILVSLSACSDSSEPSPSASKPAASAARESAAAAPADSQKPETEEDAAELAKRGKGVYLSNCIACHSPDPTLDGSLGPAVAHSSLELLEARVMRAEYVAGYVPKRDTRVMVAMPYLEAEIPALYAYLNK